MNAKLLIDAIMRQTTVLIAQLSTAAGIRAPLAQVADRVFLDLARALESHGVGRKVVADMFGMAVRGYQKKVQRLEESVTVRDQTLWEAVLEFVQDHDGAHRREILEKFERDNEEAVAAVLHDLVASGLLFVTGQGPNTAYRSASQQDLQKLLDIESAESLPSMAWATIFHNPGIGLQQLSTLLQVNECSLTEILRQLQDEGRISIGDPTRQQGLRARTLTLPVGAESGWEAAVFDHFQAMASAIVAKIQRRALRSQSHDQVGGATLHFEIASGHPFEHEVLGLLQSTRASVNALWQRVCAYNEKHPIDENSAIGVCFYFGQNVLNNDSETDSGEEKTS